MTNHPYEAESCPKLLSAASPHKILTPQTNEEGTKSSLSSFLQGNKNESSDKRRVIVTKLKVDLSACRSDAEISNVWQMKRWSQKCPKTIIKSRKIAEQKLFYKAES